MFLNFFVRFQFDCVGRTASKIIFLGVLLSLQAELAALMYKKTRLVRVRSADGRLTFGAAGEAEVVSARGLVHCQNL